MEWGRGFKPPERTKKDHTKNSQIPPPPPPPPHRNGHNTLMIWSGFTTVRTL